MLRSPRPCSWTRAGVPGPGPGQYASFRAPASQNLKAYHAVTATSLESRSRKLSESVRIFKLDCNLSCQPDAASASEPQDSDGVPSPSQA